MQLHTQSSPALFLHTASTKWQVSSALMVRQWMCAASRTCMSCLRQTSVHAIRILHDVDECRCGPTVSLQVPLHLVLLSSHRSVHVVHFRMLYRTIARPARLQSRNARLITDSFHQSLDSCRARTRTVNARATISMAAPEASSSNPSGLSAGLRFIDVRRFDPEASWVSEDVRRQADRLGARLE